MAMQALYLGGVSEAASTSGAFLTGHANQVFLGGALVVAFIGAICDILSRRIPNRLTYSAMLVAIAAHTLLQGWHGLESALLGGLLGGGAFLVFFLVHAMGGGDVKLIAAVCCLAGPAPAVEIVLTSAIAGGIFGLIVSAWRGRLRIVLANVLDLIRFHAAAGAEVHPNLNLSNPQAARLPYGVAIAAGVLYSVVALYRRGGL